MDHKQAEKITKGLKCYEHSISPANVSGLIMGFANVPHKFKNTELINHNIIKGMSYQEWQELLNRLFQRWRKMDLVQYERGKWSLTRGAWDTFQQAVSKTQTQEP